jgi:uncharacterized membrane-anchored protein
MKRTLLAAAAALIVSGGGALAASTPGAPATASASDAASSSGKVDPAKLARAKAAFDAGLTKRTGTVQLSQAKVTLNLGDRFYYLDAQDSRKVLVDAWGNPPEAASDVLGMILPVGMSPLDEDNWGAVLTFEGTGYVPDKDARKLNYDKLLDQMRKGEDEGNTERQKQGFSTVHLVGWAQPPAYDASRHSLIWARDLKFSDAKEDIVNYDVRVLGREGVFSMNIVAGASVIGPVKAAGDALQSVAAFNPGARYADYQKGDKKAAYGLGGLILAGAGIVAAKKIGILAFVFLFMKKGAVVLIAAFGGFGAWVRRKLGMRPKPPQDGSSASGGGPIVS